MNDDDIRAPSLLNAVFDEPITMECEDCATRQRIDARFFFLRLVCMRLDGLINGAYTWPWSGQFVLRTSSKEVFTRGGISVSLTSRETAG